MPDVMRPPPATNWEWLKEIDDRHKPTNHGLHARCDGCERASAWPCDAVELVQEIRRIALLLDAYWTMCEASGMKLISIDDRKIT